MLALLDWRRRTLDLYRYIRQEDNPHEAWKQFRQIRDDLFLNHPMSALDEKQKAEFNGLSYFDYDPAYRVVAKLDTDTETKEYSVEIGDDGVIHYHSFGKVQVELPTGKGELNLFWIDGYGGGVFVPFADATNRNETYGAGRYLYDTIKGADLGANFDTGEVVLDFNFAYNPSCSYNPHWVCPLAPPESRLDFPIYAGEKHVERY